MSYAILREKLVKMPAAGNAGFEGVMAVLLSVLTGERFYVSRSGDQPADAISIPAGVAIQCKRYDKTRLNETEFEGDFHKACRTIPSLDCYVVAATRTTAQLSALAEQIQNENGVDIVLLGLDGAESEVAALCVKFWPQIRNFAKLSELDDGFASWAATETAKPETKAAVDKLRQALVSSIPHAGVVQRKLQERLNVRFGIKIVSHQATRFPIDLGKAVPRAEPQQSLDRWWRENQGRAAIVIGEEGMGKSWIAAAFANSASRAGTLVLWLDSADWAGATSLEEVISTGLLLAGYEKKTLRSRLAEKAKSRWRDKLLVVLDGVNERNAHVTASKLLAELQASTLRPCRILFSSRPRLWPADQRSLWSPVAQVEARAFTEDELDEALRRLPVPISREEIPAALLPVARIPRYFQRAIALRTEFKTLRNITIEMVLWADLLEKVKSGDPQLTETIGWQSADDIQRALLKLATGARNLSGLQDANGYGLLQSSFGQNFERIRTDLVEQRVLLEATDENPTPSREHVVLGFALHLTSLLRKAADDNVAVLVDKIVKELEPTLAQDQLTEALFVALQLSALSANDGNRLSSKARSALLVAWTSSQNSRIDFDRIAFWAERDVDAYLDFVEEIYCEPVSDSWTNLIIEPLRNRWRESGGTNATLYKRIRRWLPLVWHPDSNDGAEVFAVGNQHLPRARSVDQLQLSFIALAILSESFSPEFLSHLAIAWGSDSISIRRYSVPCEPGATHERVHEIPCKNLGDNIGPVIRWIITETQKSEIERLKTSAQDGSLESKGYGYMLNAFDEFGWIRGQAPEELLRSGTPLFRGSGADAQLQIEQCTCLAVRQDIPALAQNDRDVLRIKLEALFKSEDLHWGFSRTRADLEFELLFPWFAKYHPEYLAEVATEFRVIALTHKDPGPAFSIANRMPYSPAKVPPARLLELAEKWAEDGSGSTQPRADYNLLQLHLLAFLCFGPELLLEWLRFCGNRPNLRREIHFNPLPDLAPLVIPDRIAKFAREQLKAHVDDPEPHDVSDAAFDYWATVGGTSGDPDAQFHDWVTEQIRIRQPKDQRRFYWLLLLFRSATVEQLRNLVRSSEIVQFVAKRDLRALHTAGRPIENWEELSLSLHDLASSLSIDSVGRVLKAARRDDDLNRWGEILFRRAAELLGLSKFEPEFWGTTILSQDADGNAFGRGCERESDEGEAEGLRPSDAFRNSGLTSEEFEREANRALAIWRKDLKTMEQIADGAFLHFDAWSPLENFREQNPDRFRLLAKELFEKAAVDKTKAYPLAGFLISVMAAIAPLEPVMALKMERTFEPLRVRVTNHYNVSVVAAAIWRGAGRGNDACANVCHEVLERCETDEELMWHALTAEAEGASEAIGTLARGYVRNPLAKIRCLGISLLAWAPNAYAELENLAQSDLSGWVRSHAKWAKEVSRQEADARTFYQETLTETDYNQTLCRLQVLEPALTPSANVWRFASDRTVGKGVSESAQLSLAVFWEGVESKLKTAPKLYGRELKEYLRGECVRDLKTPQPALH